MADSLAPTATVHRSPRLAQRLFEERMLVITPKDSMLHRLDAVGTFLWQQIEEPRTIDALIEAIDDHFEGFDKKENGREIVAFLSQLAKLGLVEIG